MKFWLLFIPLALFSMWVIIGEASTSGIIFAAASVLGLVTGAYLSWRERPGRLAEPPPRGAYFFLVWLLVVALSGLVQYLIDPDGLGFVVFGWVLSGFVFELYIVRRRESRESRRKLRLARRGPLTRLRIRRSLAGAQVTLHAGQGETLDAVVHSWGSRDVLAFLPALYLDDSLLNNIGEDAQRFLDDVHGFLARTREEWGGDPDRALSRRLSIRASSEGEIVARVLTTIGRIVRRTTFRPMGRIMAVKQPAFWVYWDSVIEMMRSRPDSVEKLVEDLLAQCEIYRAEGMNKRNLGKAVATVWGHRLESEGEDWMAWLGDEWKAWDAMGRPAREDWLQRQGVRAFNKMLAAQARSPSPP